MKKQAFRARIRIRRLVLGGGSILLFTVFLLHNSENIGYRVLSRPKVRHKIWHSLELVCMFPNVYVPATARHGVHIHSALPLSIVHIFPLPPSGKKNAAKKIRSAAARAHDFTLAGHRSSWNLAPSARQY